MAREAKGVVLIAFSLRLPYAIPPPSIKQPLQTPSITDFHASLIIAAITRVVYLVPVLSSTNPFLVGVVPFVCTQVEMHYSTMATTIPCLKPFTNRVNTGWGTTDTHGVSGYAMSSLDKSGNRSGGRSGGGGSQSYEDRHPGHSRGGKLRPDVGLHTVNIRSGVRRGMSKRSPSAESSGSEQMIIRRTVSTEVQYEDSQKPHAGSETRRSIDNIV